MVMERPARNRAMIWCGNCDSNTMTEVATQINPIASDERSFFVPNIWHFRLPRRLFILLGSN